MNVIQNIAKFILQYKVLLVLYVIIVVISYVQLMDGGHFNNFQIFRSSTYHFLEAKPLYIYYPDEYFDLFYYHPVFPILFLPFAMLPLKLGMFCWLLFTALACFFAFRAMPLADDKKNLFTFFLIFDLLNNLNHTQTNPLLLAFMIAAWGMLEKNKFSLGALFMVFSFLIKGYGGIIGLLCLYYKQWYKIMGYGILWFIAVNALMLLFVTPAQALTYYQDWLTIISSDTIKESFSVYGILKNMHLILPEAYILLPAFLLLAVFMIMQYMLKEKSKAAFVAFLLVWVIVFNRASEPATYIIAMGGVVLWYAIRPRSIPSTILFWITILTASILPTDISKAFDRFRYDYYLKSILCLLILTDMYIYTISRLYQQRAVKNTLIA